MYKEIKVALDFLTAIDELLLAADRADIKSELFTQVRIDLEKVKRNTLYSLGIELTKVRS